MEESIDSDVIGHRYAIVRVRFADDIDTTIPGAGRAAVISDELLNWIFSYHDNSVRNYWRRATYGLFELYFDVINGGPYLLDDVKHREAQGLGGRNRVIAATRRALERAGISLADYNHLIVISSVYPSDASATGGDVLVHQGPGSTLPFLQHEIGHTLGFQHAFGPYIPDERGHLYNDPYCVMGFTGPHSHPVSIPQVDRWQEQLIAGNEFWRSERRPSGAALLRHYPGSLAWDRLANIGGLPVELELTGLYWTDHPFRPQVVAFPRPGGGAGERFVVEYRPPNGDDAGADPPALVIHSLGIHPVGAGRGEVDPPWSEGSIPAFPGGSLNVAGIGFTVITPLPDGPERRVRIRIETAPPPPVQDGWRWCRRCQCMTFGGSGSGVCYDGNPHDLAGSGQYSLPHGSDPWPGQQGGWRWCGRCQNLCWSGTVGRCHDGSPHQLNASGKYSLYHQPE